MKTNFKFKIAPTVLMIVLMFGAAYAVPVSMYEQFANNIEEGRFILSEPVNFQGWLGDPQMAILFSEFNVNGVNIVDALRDYALLPWNVVFTQPLEDFMGGSTLIGTSAFGGKLQDASGNVIPDAQVGFGVFETNSDEKFFTPIAFTSDVSSLIGGVSFVLNLEPVVPSSVSSTFTGTGSGLFAYEFLIPEPATVLLLGLGGSALVRRRVKQRKDKFLGKENAMKASKVVGLIMAFIAVMSTKAVGNVMFNGMEWQALGQAQLNVTSDLSNRLHVTGIGSSGSDGIRMLVPDGTPGPNSELDLDFMDLGNPSNYPAGAFIQMTAWGTINGSTGQVVSIVKGSINGGDVNIKVDLTPLAPTSLTADYYLQGERVLREVGINPVGAVMTSGWVLNEISLTITWPPALTFTWCKSDPYVKSFLGDDVFVDLVVVYAQNLGNTFDGYSATDLTGADIGEFTLIPEPATVCLLGLGGLALLRKRRK